MASKCRTRAACAAGVSAYATANFGGSNSDILRAAAVAGANAAAYGQIDAGYGNTWSWSRVGLTATVGGVTAAASGGDARLAFWRTFGIASLTYANVAMRRYELGEVLSDATGLSARYNLSGESAGFYDTLKFAGARCHADLQCFSGLFGGIQGERGTFLGFRYGSGDFIDRLSEVFAGPHDFLNDMMGHYTSYGFNRPDTMFSHLTSAFNLISAAPFAAAGIVSLTNSYGLITNYCQTNNLTCK